MSLKLLRSVALSALLATCVIIAAGASAGAQDAAPTPCNGMLYTDPAGDATYFDANPEFASPGNANEDIRGVFLNYKPGSDGKNVLTVNIVLEKLDKTESGAAYATANAWEVSFGGPQGDTYYVKAVLDGTAWSFKYHYFDRVGTGQVVDPGQLVTEDTTGQAFEGPMGVLSIVIPSTLPGLKEGATLAGLDVTVIPRTDPNQGSFFTDRAPDATADDKPYKVTLCPADAAPTTTPDTTGTATPTPEPSPQGGAGQPGGQPGGTGGQPASQQQPSGSKKPGAKKKKKAKCKKAKAKKGSKKKAKKKCKKARKKKRKKR